MTLALLVGCVAAWADPAADEAPDGLRVILPAAPPKVVERFVRRLDRRGIEVGRLSNILCVGPPPDDEPVTDPFWAKAEARLAARFEVRETCDLARYPLGRGWMVARVAADPSLGDRVDAATAQLGLVVVAEPSDGSPATVCTARTQAEPDAFASSLGAVGLDVLGVYEVGGCQSRVTSRGLGRLFGR